MLDTGVHSVMVAGRGLSRLPCPAPSGAGLRRWRPRLIYVVVGDGNGEQEHHGARSRVANLPAHMRRTDEGIARAEHDVRPGTHRFLRDGGPRANSAPARMTAIGASTRTARVPASTRMRAVEGSLGSAGKMASGARVTQRTPRTPEAGKAVTGAKACALTVIASGVLVARVGVVS